MNHHQTVLLQQTVDALAIKPDGIYIDATFGRGGHSQLMLSQLGPDGKLFAIDKDPQALLHADEYFQDSRFEIIHDSFANIQPQMQSRNLLGKIDGVLLDLGVSSPQLDQSERGFSFMRNGPLDMRMDPTSGQSVSELLQTVDEADLANIIFKYGEEKFSRRIAKAIVTARDEAPITTTLELAGLIAGSIPKIDKHKHPATRTFQALRIYINNELGDLETLLSSLDAVLAPQGRLSCISFHSLEDRIVKQFIQLKTKGPQVPRGLPVQNLPQPTWRSVLRKAKAPAEEISHNVRSRSAILRAAYKC